MAKSFGFDKKIVDRNPIDYSESLIAIDDGLMEKQEQELRLQQAKMR